MHECVYVIIYEYCTGVYARILEVRAHVKGKFPSRFVLVQDSQNVSFGVIDFQTKKKNKDTLNLHCIVDISFASFMKSQ